MYIHRHMYTILLGEMCACICVCVCVLGVFMGVAVCVFCILCVCIWYQVGAKNVYRVVLIAW